MQELGGKANNRRWWALGLLCVTHLLVVIDVLIVPCSAHIFWP